MSDWNICCCRKTTYDNVGTEFFEKEKEQGPTTTQLLGRALQWGGSLLVFGGTTAQGVEAGLEYYNYSSNPALNADEYGWAQITRWCSAGSNALGVATFAVGTAMVCWGGNKPAVTDEATHLNH